MKGHSQLVRLLGIVILLCAVVLGNAASAHQHSALSSQNGTEPEGVIDAEPVQNKEKDVTDGEEDKNQKEDVIEGEIQTRSPSTNGNSTKSSFTKECECGTHKDDTRIIGGVPTTRGQYPWQAALLSSVDDMLLCGGTLINDLYILTSATCVQYNTDPASILVRLRDYNLNKPDQHKEITKNVIEIIPHKKYDPYTAPAYDIALLRLDSPLTLSQLATARPICLPSTKTELYEMEKAIATGWGITNPFSANPSSTLHEVKLRVISNDRCQNALEFFVQPSLIKNNMMCAGNVDKNICVWDQGGPLVYLNSDGFYEQIGVTSFSIFCGFYDQPSVFTRVNKFLPWIEKNTGGATYCSGFSFPE